MSEHERTIMAFDEAGNEYIIDIFVSVRDLGELQHTGATDAALPSFTTREGHAVTYLGNGEFSVQVPGEENDIRVRTHDPEFS